MRPSVGLALVLAVVLLVVAPCVLVARYGHDSPSAPAGCSRVDRNPSKGADYHLECSPASTSTSTTVPPTSTSTSSTTSSTTSTSTTVAPAVVDASVWDRLADCESGGRWHIADSVHQGGLQFAVDTWDAYAPAGYPADAHLATKAQQIAVAIRVRDGVPGTSDPYLNAQGWDAWPTCARTIGVLR